ncbi:DUF423 domain-containing protein [Paenibacillaceae bacterium]|nr:DUF423 domain-containing protein [Paenibacillaceae bacterium]
MFSKYTAFGAIYAMLAVMIGAFGAHGLEGRVEESLLATFETGARYHMYHALGLILIGILLERRGNSRRLLWAGRLMQIGIILFSGSLYVLTLSGITKLGAVTPLGGVAFIVGWCLIAVEMMKPNKIK